jgi:release factor glutamine methyltransferase
LIGLDATTRRLRAGGLDVDVVTRRRGPLGPLLSARAPALEARGLLPAGQRHEDLLVVRARRHPVKETDLARTTGGATA